MINRQKKFLSAVLVVLLVFAVFTQNVAASAPNIENLPQKGVYIRELVSDTLVYENNAAERYYPASITKLLTALTAMDYLELDETITVGQEVYAVIAGSSLADLQPGERLTFYDLLYAMMLPSGNDAANVIAAATAKKVKPNLTEFSAQNELFCSLMNKKAKELGAKDSNFVNPSGLHKSNHYTTAQDMYFIGLASLQNPTIAKVCATPVYTVAEHTWYNTNLLLQRNYDELKWTKKQGPNEFFSAYAKGLKTGHTIEAGRTIVAYYEHDNMKILVVLLHCGIEELFADANAALAYTASCYEGISFGKAGQTTAQLPVENAKEPTKILEVTPKTDATVILAKGKGEGIYQRVTYFDELFNIYFGKRFLKTDIAAGQAVGKITLYNADGIELKSVELMAKNAVVKDKFLFLRIVLFFVVIILLLTVLLREVQRRYRRNNYERKNISCP